MQIKYLEKDKKCAQVELTDEEINLMDSIMKDEVKGGVFRCLSPSGKKLLEEINNIESPAVIPFEKELGILGRVEKSDTKEEKGC